MMRSVLQHWNLYLRTLFIQLCIYVMFHYSKGFFHKELKLANVLPLYKNDDPFMFYNYRPVSLLCVISNRKWQDYVYIQCEYKSTKQKIKHLLKRGK